MPGGTTRIRSCWRRWRPGRWTSRGRTDEYEITTEVAAFHAVQEGLREQGIEFSEAELAMIPKVTVRVEGRRRQKLVRLLELLEDVDDIQNVHTNADIDESVLSEVGA
jgi:transcriptional/translational regulatory protein YebC/TACO1